MKHLINHLFLALTLTLGASVAAASDDNLTIYTVKVSEDRTIRLKLAGTKHCDGRLKNGYHSDIIGNNGEILEEGCWRRLIGDRVLLLWMRGAVGDASIVHTDRLTLTEFGKFREDSLDKFLKEQLP